MTFDEWWEQLPSSKENIFWSQKSVAKAAWEAAIESTRPTFEVSDGQGGKAVYKTAFSFGVVPEGYVLVPVEPTEVMVMAAAGSPEYMDTARTVYKAMIEAVQEIEE